MGALPTALVNTWIHFVYLVRGEVLQVDLNLDEPATKRDQFLKGKVPNIRPVIAIQIWNVSKPPLPERDISVRAIVHKWLYSAEVGLL